MVSKAEESNITKSVEDEFNRAVKALTDNQEQILRSARKTNHFEDYKKKITKDTKDIKDLLKDTMDKAFSHIDQISKYSNIRLSNNVEFEDFCNHGYIGTIIQTFRDIVAAVKSIKVDESTIDEAYKAYTTYPEFLKLTNRLSQPTPQRGTRPITDVDSIGYFVANVQLVSSAYTPDDTSYRLKYRYKKNTGGYSRFETTSDIPKESSMIRLNNLVPGSTYEVFAQEGKGGAYGDMSEEPDIFTTSPLDPPTNFRVKNAGFVDMVLEWDPVEVPETAEFKVVYKVTFKNKSSNEAPRNVCTEDADVNFIKIDKLIPGFEYEMCIATGSNDQGLPFGQPSETIYEKTKPIDPPARINAEPYCDGILLTWEDKRSEISSDEVDVFYNVQIRPKEGGNPQDVEEDPTFMDLCRVFCPRYLCKGLENGVEYEFRVRSGVESVGIGIDPIPGKYISDKRKTATIATGHAESHTWCCCVCGGEFAGEKKKALPKKAKIGFVWYCTYVNK